MLSFWRGQLKTDGGQLQVALEVCSTLAVAVAAGVVLPALVVGSYSIVLISLACCVLGVCTFAAAYKRHFVGLIAAAVSVLVAAGLLAVSGFTIAVAIAFNSVEHDAWWILTLLIVLFLAACEFGCLLTVGLWAGLFAKVVSFHTKSEAAGLFAGLPKRPSRVAPRADGGGLSSLDCDSLSASDYEDSEQVVKMSDYAV